MILLVINQQGLLAATAHFHLGIVSVNTIPCVGWLYLEVGG